MTVSEMRKVLMDDFGFTAIELIQMDDVEIRTLYDELMSIKNKVLARR